MIFWLFRNHNVEIALTYCISSPLCNLRLLNIDVEHDAKGTRMFNLSSKLNKKQKKTTFNSMLRNLTAGIGL